MCIAILYSVFVQNDETDVCFAITFVFGLYVNETEMIILCDLIG